MMKLPAESDDHTSGSTTIGLLSVAYHLRIRDVTELMLHAGFSFLLSIYGKLT